MEKAGKHLKRINIRQALTCPRRKIITLISPSKNVSEKRRLSLRSENVTVRPGTGPTTTQSPSFPTEQQPGKENELPCELQGEGSKRAAIGRTVISSIKASWNPVTHITDSARKVIKRRLSGEYDDQLSMNKSRKGNLNEPIILPPKVIEPEVEADSNHRQDITPKFSIYDDQNNTVGDRREIIDSEFSIERVADTDYKLPGVFNRRDVKSRSASKRLNLPVKRGDEISPLKRRINEFNRLKRSRTVGNNSHSEATSSREKYNPAHAKSENVFEIGNNVALQCITTRNQAIGQISGGAVPKKKVLPRIRNRQVQIDQKSEAKSTVKVSRPTKEIIPLGLTYTTDYTKESFDVELARQESCHKVSKSFLRGRIVTLEQRRIVVNFLISVHAYLLTSSSTLHQAVKMFDALLDLKDVSVKELQLVALGTTWIAIKNMETKVPSASKMISFAKDLYNAEGPGLLCRCERKILKTLGFNIRFTDPCYISAYYLQQLWSSLGPMASEPSIRLMVHHCADYLMDVALLEGDYSKTPSELLAAAVTQTAACLVLQNLPKDYLADHLLSSTQRTNNKRSYTQEDIGCVAGLLIRGVLNSAEENSSINAVYRKYKNVRYDNTSDYLVIMIKKFSGTTPA